MPEEPGRYYCPVPEEEAKPQQSGVTWPKVTHTPLKDGLRDQPQIRPAPSGVCVDTLPLESGISEHLGERQWQLGRGTHGPSPFY